MVAELLVAEDMQYYLVFTTQEVAKLMQDTQIKRWGVFDGTSDPIDLTFRDYYDQFVYDQDFKNPHIIGNNISVSSGNTINNID